MIYDDEFINSLPLNFDEAIIKIFETYTAKGVSGNGAGLLETRYLIETLATARDASIPVRFDGPGTNLHSIISRLAETCKGNLQRRAAEKEWEENKLRISRLLSVGFFYELSDPDISRIQKLLNEMRNILEQSPEFSDGHKERILNRLETLQRELHKKMSNLDKFYGLIGASGVALGKFGKDAKPFVDRAREILEIVWRSQANAEQLPASAQPALLGHDPQGDSE